MLEKYRQICGFGCARYVYIYIYIYHYIYIYIYIYIIIFIFIYILYCISVQCTYIQIQTYVTESLGKSSPLGV